jgi:hypothetical protein
MGFIGEMPSVLVQHRYKWLYVYGFIEPKAGKILWYLIPRVNHQWLSLIYQYLAQDVGLLAEKIVLLVQDNAGGHRSQKLQVPDGIMLDFLICLFARITSNREIVVSGR